MKLENIEIVAELMDQRKRAQRAIAIVQSDECIITIESDKGATILQPPYDFIVNGLKVKIKSIESELETL